jgi:hypothetical protein
MRKTGLEFAPGTTDDCKRLIGRTFKPEILLEAYRTARAISDNSDIVLWFSDQSPDIQGGTRLEFCQLLREKYGKRAAEFRVWAHSAQSIMKMPIESSAFWLVIEPPRGDDIPIMCVIFAVSYTVEQPAAVN